VSASEYIHPDWVNGYDWLRSVLMSGRRRAEQRLIETGDALIYDGWELAAPSEYAGDVRIGAKVYDRRGHPWEITRREKYEQDIGGWEGWQRRVRVYAKRIDESTHQEVSA
jgi:hypothetical protein